MRTPDLFEAIEMDRGLTLDEYLEKNPRVWDLFVKFARELRRARIDRRLPVRGSAETVVNRIRWEAAMAYGVDEFKINNNYKPGLARRLADTFPEEFGEFFSFRESKEDNDEG